LLLLISFLTYAWISFLEKPNLNFRLLKLVGYTIGGSLAIGFLRYQFVYVPISMMIVGVTILMFSRKSGRNSIIIYLLSIIGLVVTVIMFYHFFNEISTISESTRQHYFEGDNVQTADGSLGMALIVNQPIPIRLILGSIYLFVFPIPFWTGFQLESSYQLFKSCNVIFFYFVIPLLVLSVWQLWEHKTQRNPMILFMLFIVAGFTLAVAGTSLETRHHGVFFTQLFVLLLLPDLRERMVLLKYKQLLMIMITGVITIHLLWFIMKLH
jgi:hypothetical protein